MSVFSHSKDQLPYQCREDSLSSFEMRTTPAICSMVYSVNLHYDSCITVSTENPQLWNKCLPTCPLIWADGPISLISLLFWVIPPPSGSESTAFLQCPAFLMEYYSDMCAYARLVMQD